MRKIEINPKIKKLLEEGPKTTKEVWLATGFSYAHVSRLLNTYEEKDMVTGFRQGKEKSYRLNISHKN